MKKLNLLLYMSTHTTLAEFKATKIKLFIIIAGNLKYNAQLHMAEK